MLGEWPQDDYWRAHRFVTRRALRSGLSDFDADEIAVDVLSHCAKAYSSTELIWKCIKTAARNAIVDRNRARRNLLEVGPEDVDRRREPSASPLETLVDHEDRCLLDTLLSELRTTDREVLELRYMDGCSFPAIGRRLGVSPSTARYRFERALRRLDASAVKVHLVRLPHLTAA